tara:strand:+ start:635 stop:2776 length:2142 start_codon:yes stop_codon:yes gene_type:complete
MNRLKYATALDKKGFRIFPLESNKKTPSSVGWQAQAVVGSTHHWANGEDFNIGVATGAGLLVVDIDMKNGVDGEAAWAALGLDESEFQVRTPSGGRHLYYSTTADVKNSASKVADGVDVRGVGGYVVGPGSEVDGLYAIINKGAEMLFAPDALLELCKKKKKAPKMDGLDAEKLDTVEHLAEAAEYLRVADESVEGAGGDHTAFATACRVRGMGVSEGECLDLMLGEWNTRCAPPWSGDELEVKVRNAYAYAEGPIGGDTAEAQFGDEPDSGPVERRELGAVEKINQSHSLVMLGTSHVIAEEYESEEGRKLVHCYSEKSFHTNYLSLRYFDENDKLRYISKDWMNSESRRTYRGFTFDPRRVGAVDGKFNHWRGYDVEPLAQTMVEAAASCSLFLAHLRDIVCRGNRDHARWVLNHFAHMIQFPWKKPETAIVVVGEKGCGKSAIFDIMGRLVRDNYFPTAERRMLLGNFNSHMETVLLFQLEEALWAGDKQAEGKLKHLITGKTHIIERKGFEPYKVGNYARIYMTSNERWAVPATVDERRFTALECLGDKMGDKAYFKAMFKQLDDGGYRSLMTLLLGWKVDKTAVHVALSTDALGDQKMENLGDDGKWLYDCLMEGCISGTEFDEGWGDRIEVKDVYDSYLEHTKKSGVRYPKSTHGLGRGLRKMLGEGIKRERRYIGKSNKWLYRFEDLSACRAEFSKWFGHLVEWDN